MTTDNNEKYPDETGTSAVEAFIDASHVDEEPVDPNRRLFSGRLFHGVMVFSIFYSAFHLYVLNIAPLETWSFRLLHICGALILGYTLYAARSFESGGHREGFDWRSVPALLLLVPALYTLWQVGLMQRALAGGSLMRIPESTETWRFGIPLLVTTGLGIILSWFTRRARHAVALPDIVLIVCSVSSIAYLLVMYNTPMRMSTGTSFAPVGISYAAVAGIASR